MGVSAGASVKKVAFVKCAGTCEKAKQDYDYTGVEDCAAMAFVPNGGPKTCNYGCLGFGSCVKACPFDETIIPASFVARLQKWMRKCVRPVASVLLPVQST